MTMEPNPIAIFLLLTFSLLTTKTLSLSSHQNLTLLHPITSTTTLAFQENSDPFSLQLHHIDTLLHTNTNKSQQHLLKLRLTRDSTRVKLLSSRTSNFSGSVISGLTQGSGEYFTRIGIGTPPRYVYMVLDTGSDVVWLQCKPCKNCYSQSDPVFNPTKSRTFLHVPCKSPLCRKLDSPSCNKAGKKCLYQVSYGDGSFTVGEFSTETLSLRGVKVPRVALGCGHDNEGLFTGAAGLLGLGQGRLSFPVQAGRRFNRKFSYCLVDRSVSSKPSWIIFGELSVSRTARYTPLLKNPNLSTFYYVELVGISVGGTRVRGIRPSLFRMDKAGKGGVIIDSGTSVTRLARLGYVALRNAFRVRARNLKRAPGFSLFDTCFDLSGLETVTVPTVVLHFKGANVALPAANYLIPVDSKGTFCFAFAGTTGVLSIIGNIQQQGFRIVFDLASSRVGFSPRGC